MEPQSEIWDKLYENKLTWHYKTEFDGDIKGKKVLELGVGTGKTIQSLIKQKPKEIVAIDNSKEAAKMMKKQFSDKVKIVEMDVRNMSFENNSFDVIFCYYVLNNMLKKDREKAVKEMRRVLAKKGKVYFEDFAVEDFRQCAEKAREVEKNTIQKKNGLICHFFEEKEVKEMFNGFNTKMKTKTFKPFRAINKERMIINAIIRRD
jgi:ubiquinone/menaquinone biosynthesis C-methylase UbiE